MVKNISIYFFILGLILPGLAVAEIYKWTDEKGEVHFSDKPHDGATPVDLPPLQTYHPGLPPSADAESDKSQTFPPSPILASRSYKSIRIISPEKESTVRNEQGAVPIVVSLEPALTQGDKVVVLLDGQPVGVPQDSTTITLSNIDRGEHKVLAQIIDPKGTELGKSEEVTFFVHRATKEMRERDNQRQQQNQQ